MQTLVPGVYAVLSQENMRNIGISESIRIKNNESSAQIQG